MVANETHDVADKIAGELLRLGVRTTWFTSLGEDAARRYLRDWIAPMLRPDAASAQRCQFGACDRVADSTIHNRDDRTFFEHEFRPTRWVEGADERDRQARCKP